VKEKKDNVSKETAWLRVNKGDLKWQGKPGEKKRNDAIVKVEITAP